MKKIILLGMLAFFMPNNSQAQKHAPKIYTSQNVSGIYPEGSTRLLRNSDIQGLTSWDLKIMRNEIFARKGYIFKTEDMTTYFSSQSWYDPKYSKVDKLLSSIEKRNIEYIKKYE